MAGTITSLGIGSGLDVNSIVSKLVAIEKQPLVQLQAQATNLQAEFSLYGTIKSQVSSLGDAAATLSTKAGWTDMQGTSSNSAAVGVTTDTTASAANFSVSVQQLATSQTVASGPIAAGAAAGASGSLQIEVGTWTGTTFTPTGTKTVAVSSTDTLSTIAANINAAGAGVTATILKDGTNERLTLQSSSTGSAAGFRLNTPADPGLAPLGLTNPSDGASFLGQTAQDAKVTINGVAVTSATNQMVNEVPGVTLQLNQVTSNPVAISISPNLTTITNNIQAFVNAYNQVNSTIAAATKYDASTKTAAPLQGDVETISLQNTLRAMLGGTVSGSSYSYLSQIGIQFQTDGSLTVNSTQLANAEQNLPNLQSLFTASNTDPTTNGFGVRIRDFAQGMVAFDGGVTNKANALQQEITDNSTAQDNVNTHADAVQAQLVAQYSALDAQMATLNSLSSYMTSQIAQWNKSSA